MTSITLNTILKRWVAPGREDLTLRDELDGFFINCLKQFIKEVKDIDVSDLELEDIPISDADTPRYKGEYAIADNGEYEKCSRFNLPLQNNLEFHKNCILEILSGGSIAGAISDNNSWGYVDINWSSAAYYLDKVAGILGNPTRKVKENCYCPPENDGDEDERDDEVWYRMNCREITITLHPEIINRANILWDKLMGSEYSLDPVNLSNIPEPNSSE